jgi:predicted nucleotidyltransferase
MRQLADIVLTPIQLTALSELRRLILSEFEVEKVVLYGSAARGEADAESDTDLLIITRMPLQRSSRHRITDLVFDINLNYGTNFSSLVIDRETWETGAVSVLPLHDEILRDGVTL